MDRPFSRPASQIGFAVPDLDAAVQGWERLGIGPWEITTGVELGDFAYRCRPSRASVNIARGRLGDVGLELVQPVDDEPSSYHAAVKRGATALHNISWTVDELDASVAAAEEMDAVILQSGIRDGRRFTSFGPTGGTGTIVELVEGTEGDPAPQPAPSDSTSASPFAKGADQIGFAVPDLDKAVHGWLQLGVGPWLTIKNAKVAGYEYRGQHSAPKLDVAFAQLGSLQLELIRPADDERSAYRDSIEAGGRGLQHLGWFVDDLDAAMATAKDQGGKVLQTGSWSGVHFAYFEPADGNGTITELIGMNDLSREMFGMIAKEADVADWDGKSHPSRNVLLAADWGLRWHATRAQVASMLHRE